MLIIFSENNFVIPFKAETEFCHRNFEGWSIQCETIKPASMCEMQPQQIRTEEMRAKTIKLVNI